MIPSSTSLNGHFDKADKGLIEASISIISTVCKTQPSLKTQTVEAKTGGEKILAVISLVGDVDVTIFLGLWEPAAVSLTARFAGFDIPFDSSDMADAVGELTNMIAGDLKARLDKSGIRTSISVPTVFRGIDLTVTNPSWEHIRNNYFSTDMGDFMTGLCARKK